MFLFSVSWNNVNWFLGIVTYKLSLEIGGSTGKTMAVNVSAVITKLCV